ncbi:fimbria/pilus outer membrane usher protein [Pseudomonas aeruginosa]|uniref:fimbria/pilus outer membrane usher protein n=1 Tax=Pseudomonas aeruginosa TaxID=287 RepID=UPI002163AD3E|nr:fimbria/pilus outer membrane usher protein [Pseudomonas aeruginosa]
MPRTQLPGSSTPACAAPPCCIGGPDPRPYVGDTFALVEAKGASGAGVRRGQGARVNGNGYAVVPSLSPYRYNPVSLDPQGMGEEAELLETERKIAPYAGAAVHVKFRTLTGHPIANPGPTRRRQRATR